MSTLVGVKLGVSTLVGVKFSLPPKDGSPNTVATEGDGLDLPCTVGLFPLGDRSRTPLVVPDVFRASDLPLELLEYCLVEIEV